MEQVHNFEGMLRQIEQIAAQLEQGNLSLEDSLVLYEQGVQLIDCCEQKLAAAQTRIDALRIQNGVYVEQPFEEGSLQ